jgi:hypothetical protein
VRFLEAVVDDVDWRLGELYQIGEGQGDEIVVLLSLFGVADDQGDDYRSDEIDHDCFLNG